MGPISARVALQAAGCNAHDIFTDTISGSKTARPGLDLALRYLRQGDTLMVWRLDRLGRSFPHLIETMTTLHDWGIGFLSLKEQIDTTTPAGKLIFQGLARWPSLSVTWCANGPWLD